MEGQEPTSPLAEYTLQFPVKWGKGAQETEVTTLSFLRRPIGSDLRGCSATLNTMDDQVTVLSRLLDKPRSFFDRMDAGDLVQLMGVASGFLMDGTAGKKSSDS